jgi:hypothetical protein
MAEYTTQLLSNETLAQALQAACIHRAKHEFSSATIMSQYEQIYYRVLGIEQGIQQ